MAKLIGISMKVAMIVKTFGSSQGRWGFVGVFFVVALLKSGGTRDAPFLGGVVTSLFLVLCCFSAVA